MSMSTNALIAKATSCSDTFSSRVQMPILDGSGQFWVEQFAAVGLNPAYKPDSEELVRKQSWRPNTPITVYDHDSFITLYPAGLYRRITAGVEPLDSPVIGMTLNCQLSPIFSPLLFNLQSTSILSLLTFSVSFIPFSVFLVDHVFFEM
jgi:hypothetical protein